MFSVTIHFISRDRFKLGSKYKPIFKISNKLPHPNMEARNEWNIYLLGYRIAVTWRRK